MEILLPDASGSCEILLSKLTVDLQIFNSNIRFYKLYIVWSNKIAAFGPQAVG